MTIKLSTGLRNALAAGPGFAPALANGVIYIYSGSQPLTADAAATGTLLGIVTKDGGAFAHGTATNGLTLGPAVSGIVGKSADNWRFTGLAAGTAGWFRFAGNPLDSMGVSATHARMDGAAGAYNSGDLTLSNLSIVVNVPVTIDVFSFEVPAQ